MTLSGPPTSAIVAGAQPVPEPSPGVIFISHLVQIQTQIRDPVALTAACRRLTIPAPVHRTVRLYSQTATGLAIELPGWRYPVLCQTDTGQLRYDNYGGQWGAEAELQKFVQAYAVEKTLLEARKAGHTAWEQPLEDGSIRIQITTAV